MGVRKIILMLSLVAAQIASFNAAAITDEIQVYTDEINSPGERGLELHLNTTPSGRTTPGYPGDLAPAHGLRLTPEFSWGLGRDFEAGLYFPSALTSDGNWYLGGVKGRLKWMPVHGSDDEGGWYAGANWELSRLTKKFSDSPMSTELRLMVGYRSRDWLIGVNPIIEWGLSNGYRGSPDVTLAWKAVHRIAKDINFGAEYYNDIGTPADRLPQDQQQRMLFLVAEFEQKTWSLDLGIGRGMTTATDHWTVKAIIGTSF